jgi:hypothetical protein
MVTRLSRQVHPSVRASSLSICGQPRYGDVMVTMPHGSTAPQDAELARLLANVDSHYRAASLRLDLARLMYYRLKLDSADPGVIEDALENMLELARERDALRQELDVLENSR